MKKTKRIPPTEKEIIKEYEMTLRYVLSNLSYRTVNPKTCATDKDLVKYIKYALNPRNMQNSVDHARMVNKHFEKTKAIDPS